MKILNFGSLNIDMVYQMEHFIRRGETFPASRMEKFPGGKGLNQSVALARAGAKVWHAGNVGADGGMLLDVLEQAGVDANYVRTLEEVTGHAVIQVDPSGENSIILYAGANGGVTLQQIDSVLQSFEAGDYLILQNEIAMLKEIIDRAFDKGMIIVLNPSPINEVIKTLPLEKVSYLLLNEVEGEEIAGKKNPEDILDVLLCRYPLAKIVLTLGGNGSIYADASGRIRQEAYRVEAVDTVAAGDTFTGYFITTLMRTNSPKEALDIAAKASALAVSKKGAAPSIPTMEAVLAAKLTKETK